MDEPVLDLPIGEDMSPEDRMFALHINEIQLLLAEKRTALAVLRTGIAIMALPISVLSVLIATSRLYDLAAVWQLLVPVILISVALAALAVNLVMRSMRRLLAIDRLISLIKRESPRLARLVS